MMWFKALEPFYVSHQLSAPCQELDTASLSEAEQVLLRRDAGRAQREPGPQPPLESSTRLAVSFSSELLCFVCEH